MDKKFCIECGASLSGTATFCTACGRRQPNFVPRPAARPVNKETVAPVTETVPVPEPVIEPTADVVPVPEPVIESAAEEVAEFESVVEAAAEEVAEVESVVETAAETVAEPESVVETTAEKVIEAEPIVEAAPEAIAAETAEEPAASWEQPVHIPPEPVHEQVIAAPEEKGGLNAGYIALIAGALAVVALLMWSLLAMNKLIVTDVSESRSMSVHVPPEPDTPPVTVEPQDDYSGVGGYLSDFEVR